MHGVLIRDKREITETERAADIAAGEDAMRLLTDVIEGKKLKSYTIEYFTKTMELLKLNPELTLCWNFRREILSSWFIGEGEQDGAKERLMKELELLNSVMVDLRMTKSYCLWNHRRWIVGQMMSRGYLGDHPSVSCTIISGEMDIIKKIHDLDSRNFHAWSYRNFLCDTFNLELDDMSYSTKLIETDFSNYSAWFLRMKQATRASHTNEMDPTTELELVWNAIFTEPNDQSAWQYHDWLLSRFPDLQEADAEMLSELESVVEEKDMKYVLLQKLKVDPTDFSLRERLAIIDPMRKGYYLDESYWGKSRDYSIE
jgi:geranylgeranyl transferase type-2 subunit alpha